MLLLYSHRNSFPVHVQILRDVPKARREVDLHWRVAAHENIVNLIDIYENVYMGHRSLLVVMEWLALSIIYIAPYIRL